MGQPEGQVTAGSEISRRLFVYNGGFLFQRRVRRILQLAGYQISLGRPGPDDLVGIWGASPTAQRGIAVAESRGAPLVRIEDPFLRSLHPGRAGDAPLGLLIDRTGLHFDPTQPSDLETLLATHTLDDHALLNRARHAMARMQAARLSKYSAHDPDTVLPEPGYVLVVDQVRGDASVTASKADRNRFLEMLFVAREEHPNARILLKTHPETARGLRPGYFREGDGDGNVTLFDGKIAPFALLEGATAVYTVSSQMGFEAIIAGHRPRVFGQPFYSGWGLSDDENPVARRQRKLTRAQLVAAALILYPTWYDPYHDRLCALEQVLDTLEARARAWSEDCRGWVARDMRLWKRPAIQGFFGTPRGVVFKNDGAAAHRRALSSGRRLMGWASKADPAEDIVRIEDGFLRSRGLGAELVPPLSLVVDKTGIYYDPARTSDLETMIRQSAAGLRPDESERAERLMARLIGENLSKYNLSGDLPVLPTGRRILVPGQVEDDASILRGSPDIRSNTALLEQARTANPDAVILWKPHPDVEAGLRKGRVEDPGRWADATLSHVPIAPLLSQVDEVWTLTSLAGFEALLRGCKVTTLGAPFYAGWGLTRDLGPVPERRLAGPRPDLNALVHATLIRYPRYRDPVTGLACPAEVIVERLAAQDIPRTGAALRIVSKVQGLLASQAHLWRR
ncbi:capsular polysaccharide biosynthesis protein [Thalassococcus sp. CAU 1522]|uniref:Capsular polysaccharide biosynthesis protein n=1 Tax=Thalassococcus arenae TaxID=2851652 RepID=A0ABS6N8K0_9RHOB|nr:capsular polysaccharide biosynthesis protein [Thalassococcus arenae]MBV2360329.1 capsular polysaccharide biosynthesis protein [Thalassococcus arenae]